MEGDVEVFRNPFEDPPEATAEAEPGATIYIRVPASLKRSVDEAAKSEKLSGNVWAMRCVEHCLNSNPYPDAKEALAMAYAILTRISANAGMGGHEQVMSLLNEVKEQLGEAWCSLDFADNPKHPDFSANIVQSADQVELKRLLKDYPLLKTDLLKKVDELVISVRASHCFNALDIVYIGDLVQKSEAEMLRWPNLGRKGLNDIKLALAEMGLHLGMEVPGWPPENIERIIERIGE
jgi:hypothetical protein